MDGKARVAPEDLQGEPGSALAAIGAVALLVSLWMPWFADVSGWSAFEVWNLVLAALASVVLVVVAGRLELIRRRPDGWLWVCSISTVVIVVENLINHPPIIQLASAVAGHKAAPGTGIWVALAAGVAMVAGAALIRFGVGAPHEVAQGETAAPDASESPPASAHPAEALMAPQQAAARRAAIATALARTGFVAADDASSDEPAVEVLAELLPPAADISLCLSNHDVSSSGQYTFTESAAQFPHRGGAPARNGSDRAFVVCTKDALCWTASHALSDGYDRVTLYSVSFRDILGADVRNRRKGIVDVWIADGPTLSFRVEPNSADALQAEVDRAAQSE